MPDWAPVPNLPSVQATVASAQPAHLLGVDHMESDGFGKGFTSVMNMRKTLGEMELGKLIQEATDDKGVVHWDQFNSLAKKGSPNLRLLLGDYAKEVQARQDSQVANAIALGKQNAANDVLYQKGLESKTQHDSTQTSLAKMQSSYGVPFTVSNPSDTIDSGKNTMWQPLADFHLGNKEEKDVQNINGQVEPMIRAVGLSPHDKVQVNSQTQQIASTNPRTGEKMIKTVQNQVHPDGTVTHKTLGVENTAESNKAKIFDQQAQDWAINKAPEFNKNMLNIDAALDAFDKSKGRSTWDPDIAKLENRLGRMATNQQIALAMGNKDIAALKNGQLTNAHIDATSEALGGTINDPRLREYALYVMAKNYLLHAMEGIRMQNSNEKEYNAHNYGQVGGAPAVADLMIMNALKQRHPNVYKDIVNLNTFLNHKYESEYNNQRAIQKKAAETDPYWNYRLGDLQNRLLIRKK